MENKKKGMSTLAKLGIGCGGFIVLIIIIAAIAGSGSKGSNTQKVTNPDKSSGETTNNQSKPAVTEKMTITNSNAKDKGYGMWEVVGEVKNNDSIKHSATLKATFYGDSGQILGTASGAVNDVTAGETKTFNLISVDSVTGYKEMKVQVDTLI